MIFQYVYGEIGSLCGYIKFQVDIRQCNFLQSDKPVTCEK